MSSPNCKTKIMTRYIGLNCKISRFQGGLFGKRSASVPLPYRHRPIPQLIHPLSRGIMRQYTIAIGPIHRLSETFQLFFRELAVRSGRTQANRIFGVYSKHRSIPATEHFIHHTKVALKYNLNYID